MQLRLSSEIRSPEEEERDIYVYSSEDSNQMHSGRKGPLGSSLRKGA